MIIPGLGWAGFSKWLFRLLPYILIVGVFLYAFLVVMPENAKLKGELADASEKYTELEERFSKYEERVEMMNGNVSGQITIRTQQSSVRDRMNDVEVITNDQPFVDGGLRTRAGVLRDYQKSSPVFGRADR
jgi:hypothetical protein